MEDSERDAAKDEPPQRAPAVGADDDQPGIALTRDPADLVDDGAVGDDEIGRASCRERV